MTARYFRYSDPVLVYDGPCQKRPFCLSWSCVKKILVFLGPDQNSHRNYVKSLINKSSTVTLREVRLRRYRIPSAKYKEQYFSNVRAPRSMGDAVHAFGLTLYWNRLGFESMQLRSMRDTVHLVPRGARWGIPVRDRLVHAWCGPSVWNDDI
jgi:hypothetical protein